MNLLKALAETPLTWQLEKSSRPREPGSTSTLPTLLLTVVAQPGAAPLSKHFPVYTDLSVEQMMAVLLKAQLRDNPVLVEWLASKGNEPVRLALSDDALDGIGEPMHTALRKLADSTASVLTWNALHHVHTDDRVAVWAAAASVVRDAFANNGRPTRRNLAASLKDHLITVLKSRPFEPVRDATGKAETRTPAQDFALRTLWAGCELTDMDEWMWGWLGYVVEDMPEEALA
jgi:hypothetical protein